LYSGLLTTVFSFLESYLSIICNEYNVFTGVKLKLKDINGSNNIERANRYFKLVLRIELEKLDNYRIPISEFWKIRNCIVHRNSNFMVEEDKSITEQKLFPIIKKNKTIQIDESQGILYLTGSDEIKDLIDNIKGYFNSLCNLINDKKIVGENYIDNLPF
jgi:hypothetical protein